MIEVSAHRQRPNARRPAAVRDCGSVTLLALDRAGARGVGAERWEQRGGEVDDRIPTPKALRRDRETSPSKHPPQKLTSPNKNNDLVLENQKIRGIRGWGQGKNLFVRIPPPARAPGAWRSATRERMTTCSPVCPNDFNGLTDYEPDSEGSIPDVVGVTSIVRASRSAIMPLIVAIASSICWSVIA